MKVFFEDKWWNINFPDDVKYFKLTRRYYPCLGILLDEREIEIKYLKCSTEVRSGTFNLHHLRPKSRGGSSTESNLLKMDISRHNALHLLFGNLTLLEIIELLKRVYEIKERQRFSKFI
jgi:hypothetical protein